MANVKNVGTTTIDLSDGRTLAPGETAEGISIERGHNKRLVDEGWLAEIVTEPAVKPKAAATATPKGRSNTEPEEAN